MSQVILFAAQNIAPSIDHPREEQRIVGNPLRTTWNHFSTDSGLSAGVWASEPGSWRIETGANENEFFCVESGRCRIVDQAGHGTEVGPGDSAVIPAGFKGLFEVLETMKKSYFVVHSAA